MVDHHLYKLEDWRKLAGIRQGIINKLESRIRRLEAEVEELRAVTR